MLIWFVVLSVVLVAVVFRSGGVDYRFVVVGALLPVGEGLLGGPKVFHSLLGPALALGILMGMMCHLVLDGAFARTDVFWWPFAGWAFADGQIPEWDHLGLSIVLELVGIAVGVWAWKLFGLDDPEARRRFWHEGRLDLPS